MGIQLDVSYEGKLCYQILIRSSFDDLAGSIKNLKGHYQKACIVSDSNVAREYMDVVSSRLEDVFPVLTQFVFPAGEQSKNLDTVQDLYEQLVMNHFDRHDLLIALGGGVVGDLTGFAAATYMRGIDFIQVPTTLLAQVDSSVGGKTGVDFRSYKNMVGAFYMPRLVYMNVASLKSLPDVQFQSGMGEVIKHGLIRDSEYYQWLHTHRSDVQKMNLDALSYMVTVSADIKRRTVEKDPKEHGIRAHLNFGHTLGHAVEKLSGFRLYHGQCVAIGMAGALYLSHKLGRITQEEMDEAIAMIQSYDLPVKVKLSSYEGMTREAILKATKSDKKMQGSHVKFVILESVGCADTYPDFTDKDLMDAIDFISES